MTNDHLYDVAIIGGGLAGLALSIQVARQGHSVLLLEKERYPFHKVCGEYISLESWDFLCGLGVDLPGLKVSGITRLQVSAPGGSQMEQVLPLGGFGISRYLLDDTLACIAHNAGAVLVEGTRVTGIYFNEEEFVVEASQQSHRARVVCGSFGKRSNIDIRWKRKFAMAPKNKLNNYIGVKYHITTDFPVDTIALHTFPGGYCGIVKIEGDKYCLCYLTTAANLQKSGGNIRQMENTILAQNPRLKEILDNSSMLYEAPLTISQISFDEKSLVEDHVLMTGDAAGMITPLCGNGMSMALHGSKLAAREIHLFLQGSIARQEMEDRYTLHWQRAFGKRLRMGRRIQRWLGDQRRTALLIRTGKLFPSLMRWLIRQTHGEAF